MIMVTINHTCATRQRQVVGSVTAPSASMRHPAPPRRPPALAIATTSTTRYRCMTVAARAASAGLCCLGRGVRTSEGSVPSRPWLLQPHDDARPRGAVASGGEEAAAGEDDEWGARGRRRPRFLCLHGFRTSGEIMRLQVTGRWPAEVTSRVDLVFPDAPFPAGGASPVAGVFDPPYFEWCQFDGEDFLSWRNLDRCLSYVEVLMVREGPFDGLLGFSQGAAMSAVLAGLQEQGLALTGVGEVRDSDRRGEDSVAGGGI